MACDRDSARDIKQKIIYDTNVDLLSHQTNMLVSPLDN